MSNKEKAIAYAADKGIILTVEDRDNFDGDYTVEVWSLQDQDQDQDQDHQDRSDEVEVWVCECCALWLIGDHSSCRDYFNHTHPNCDAAITDLTGAMFTVGYFHTNCNGCGRIQRTGAILYGAIRAIN